MIALQEELDWDVYHRYGLITDDEAAELVAEPGSVPDIRLGERAFEIVMARRMKAGELETQWFARHRSTPVIEIPEGWPEEYRAVVAKRIEFIERNRNIGLIERPECKRRWLSEKWEDKEAGALQDVAAGSVRGAVAVVRAGRAAPGDDGQPARRPAAPGRRRGVRWRGCTRGRMPTCSTS